MDMPYVIWSLQGSLGDLARSLGKDTTLIDILQILDEHYGMVMMFDTMSKELYSLKQESRGEHGRIWSALAATGPDTPVRVSGKNPTGPCGGDEVGSLLQGTEPQMMVDVGP